jgi:hypothetical protein
MAHVKGSKKVDKLPIYVLIITAISITLEVIEKIINIIRQLIHKP